MGIILRTKLFEKKKFKKYYDCIKISKLVDSTKKIMKQSTFKKPIRWLKKRSKKRVLEKQRLSSACREDDIFQ